MTATENTASSSRSSRVVFIDQARALAIALMLVGHSLDRFLGEPWRSGEAYQNYQFVRGISSALFLTVSGFSFVIATFGHWDDYLRFSPRLWARARRVLLILLLGCVLHLFAPTLSQSIARVNPSIWERFVRFDVLQVIAFGLAALHVIVWVSRRREHFYKTALILLFAVLAIAAVTYRPDVDARLPTEIAAALNMHHQSRFPVVPYFAYILLGAVLGYWFWRKSKDGDEWKVFAWAVALSVSLFAFEFVIRNWIAGGLFPYSTPCKFMPGNTFARAGCALLAVSGLYLLGRRRIVLERLSFVLSKDALSIFFVHLLLVYGGSSYPSCFESRAGAMTPLQVASWIVGLSIAMTAMAWTINRLRQTRPTLLETLRRGLILGGAIAFFAWPELSIFRIALSLAAGALIVAAFNYIRMRPHGDRELAAEHLPSP